MAAEIVSLELSGLARWRKRLGEAGVEELLAGTTGAAKHAGVIKASSAKRVIVDTTVMPKGKARTPYEFGVKVSITTTHREGPVVGARSMPGNPYDSHTLEEALEQAAILNDVKPEIAIVDRDYRGAEPDGVKVNHPRLRRGITRTLRAMIGGVARWNQRSVI
jgi:IS5 family transposase